MGLFGSTKQLSGTPAEVLPLREGLASFLSGRGFSNLFPDYGSDEQLLAPYRAAFEERNKMTLGQAKESAGNLTGSGFGNIMGAAAGRAATDQGAFLSDILFRAREGEANRYASMLQMLAGSGVSGPQYAYQPGFMDYLFSGASKVGSAYAGAA